MAGEHVALIGLVRCAEAGRVAACVDPKDPTRPAPGLISYDVTAPLWSDGADKQRYFAIPDGKTITITSDDDWDLPIGSVAGWRGIASCSPPKTTAAPSGPPPVRNDC